MSSSDLFDFNYCQNIQFHKNNLSKSSSLLQSLSRIHSVPNQIPKKQRTPISIIQDLIRIPLKFLLIISMLIPIYLCVSLRTDLWVGVIGPHHILITVKLPSGLGLEAGIP